MLALTTLGAASLWFSVAESGEAAIAMSGASLALLFFSVACNDASIADPKTAFDWRLVPLRAQVLQALALGFFVASSIERLREALVFLLHL